MSLFIDLCQECVSYYILRGYSVSMKQKDKKYELFSWSKDSISFELVLEYYDNAISYMIYLDGNPINTIEYYRCAGVPFTDRYEYHDHEGIKAGVLYFFNKTEELLNMLPDSIFVTKLKEYTIDQDEMLNAIYLEKADNLYLSGDFKGAKELYEKCFHDLNVIQQKRLIRINKKLINNNGDLE